MGDTWYIYKYLCGELIMDIIQEQYYLFDELYGKSPE